MLKYTRYINPFSQNSIGRSGNWQWVKKLSPGPISTVWIQTFLFCALITPRRLTERLYPYLLFIGWWITWYSQNIFDFILLFILLYKKEKMGNNRVPYRVFERSEHDGEVENCHFWTKIPFYIQNCIIRLKWIFCKKQSTVSFYYTFSRSRDLIIDQEVRRFHLICISCG